MVAYVRIVERLIISKWIGRVCYSIPSCQKRRRLVRIRLLVRLLIILVYRCTDCNENITNDEIEEVFTSLKWLYIVYRPTYVEKVSLDYEP